MNIRLLLFLLTGCLFCCQCTGNEIPNTVLGKEKMVPLLIDLHEAEAYINVNFPLTDTSKYLYNTLEDSILVKHQIDHVTFDSSMAFYKRNLKLLDEIYVSVVDSLSLKEGDN